MKTFYYKAKVDPQKTIEGQMEAQNREQVVAHLTSKGFFPLEITAQDKGKGALRISFPWTNKRPSLREKTAFLSQIADLSSAGMPLLRSLELLSSQNAKPSWTQVLTNLRDSVRGGMSFSDALEKHPLVFSGFIINMTRAGEQSGAFDNALREVSQALEREAELKSKISQSLIYPSVIFSFGILTIVVLLTFVIPKLEELYQDFGGTLPFFTQIVIGISRFLTSFWWLILLSAAGAYFYIQKRIRQGETSVRSMISRIPWFGRLVDLEDTVHFTRTLGILLRNGISILEALTSSGEIVENKIFKNQISKIRDMVSQGESMSKASEFTKVFSPLTISFIQTGEETGTLDSSLEKISRTYEKEIEERIKILTTLMEPFLILIIGTLVGIIVISMLLPIFQISTLVH